MKNWMISILTIALIHFNSFGQFGYFGSFNSIDLEIDVGPSFRFNNQLENNILTKTSKFVNLDYTLTYTRSYKNNRQVGIGYFYSGVRTNGQNTRLIYEDENNNFKPNVLGDDFINYHGMELSWIRYLGPGFFGSGIFLGFSANFGMAKIKSGTTINYGWVTDPIEKSTFKETYNTDILGSYIYTKNVKLSSGNVHFNFGKAFPISEYISVVIKTSLPLFILGKSDRGQVVNFWSTAFDSFSGKVDLLNEPEGFDKMFVYAIRKHATISFDFGLKFFL